MPWTQIREWIFNSELKCNFNPVGADHMKSTQVSCTNLSWKL